MPQAGRKGSGRAGMPSGGGPWCARKRRGVNGKSRPSGRLFCFRSWGELLASSSGGVGSGGRSVSSRGRSVGSRSGHVSSRSGGFDSSGSSSRRFDGGSRLFLLAASGDGQSDQGGDEERLFHFWFPCEMCSNTSGEQTCLSDRTDQALRFLPAADSQL